ncbi:thioredoxin family protein [Seonamhaeicola sp.]|uniref:protein-disulfide reductase DsbD family protein n=1 Tax=Seonamhaeicola sp. TaxID=1912245 RepID=UPI002609F962|nr:thioredoxin family protein [Seonamhaeicola sp.]
MKKLLVLLVLAVSTSSFSQILEPVKWSTSVERISDTEYKLISKASIEPKWHLYSQDVPEGGPIPTTFAYDVSKGGFKTIDKTIEPEGHTVDDPVFDMKIKFFEDEAIFEQNIEVTGATDVVYGTVEFMVCDDSRCLPPETIDLVFNIPGKSGLQLGNDQPKGIFDPVKWQTSVKKVSDTEYDLLIEATIDDGWHLYSQEVPEDGPIATTFTFDNSAAGFTAIGKTLEPEGHTVDDPVFNMKIKFFENVASFTQKIKLTKDINEVRGTVDFMVCNDERCLAPTTIDLVFPLNSNAVSNIATTDDKATSNIDNVEVNNILYGMDTSDIRLSDVKCANELVSNASEVKKTGKSLWSIFGLGFLGGLLALLTPCVFPMIPLTVSFFTKKSGQSKGSGISKALLYGFFIFAVYVLLSVPFHLLDSVNPDILNEISTNVWLNVLFFAIFLFFAFSFFGYYELTLPSSWTSKTTKGESAGGLIGIFFMALTLAIVSFSCTGPILGSLLAGSLTADGGAWQLTAGMAGFGVSLGLPFALFAMFPNMMNALPKSGGWLNTTKVVLGFLELALAFKFLSNADLVEHWGILKIEPFLIIWIVIFGGLALYLFGKIKFPHDSPIKKLSFTRISFAILVAAFTVYLASGFRVNKDTKTFTPLTLLSGLAPPVGYSFIYPNDCPNNLSCFKDLKSGIEYAKKVNKPIMLDFTGYACVNCRKMEEHVWPLAKIDKYLRNDYVLISLYVDDKKELPEHEQIEVNRVNGGTRKLENYGHKWANFQTQFFQTNSQPYYVLLNSDGTQILNEAVGYTPNEDAYAQFLECGLEVSKSTSK